MKEAKMKRFLLGVALACCLAMLSATPSFADNYSGKIDLMQFTSSGIRFFVKSTALSLFASGDAREILLVGFYRKASLSIGYTPTPCPPGISGTCGNVSFVSVDSTNF